MAGQEHLGVLGSYTGIYNEEQEGYRLLNILFTEDAWEYARHHARSITITQEKCRG